MIHMKFLLLLLLATPAHVRSFLLPLNSNRITDPIIPRNGLAATQANVEEQLLDAQKALVALDEENQVLSNTVDAFRKQMIQYQGQLTDSILRGQEMKNQLEANKELSEKLAGSATKLELALTELRSQRVEELENLRRDQNSLRRLMRRFFRVITERTSKRVKGMGAAIKSALKPRRKTPKDEPLSEDCS